MFSESGPQAASVIARPYRFVTLLQGRGLSTKACLASP